MTNIRKCKNIYRNQFENIQISRKNQDHIEKYMKNMQHSLIKQKPFHHAPAAFDLAGSVDQENAKICRECVAGCHQQTQLAATPWSLNRLVNTI